MRLPALVLGLMIALLYSGVGLTAPKFHDLLLSPQSRLCSAVPIRKRRASQSSPASWIFTVTPLDWTGPTYGVGWGLINDDLYPDLYVNNHGAQQNQIRIFNPNTAAFDTRVFLSTVSGDEHGVAFADFDRDGDQDLAELTGGGLGTDQSNMTKYADHFYVNMGGTLTESAASFGLTNGVARGRSPFWYDFNHDGWVDTFFGAALRPDGLWGPTAYINNQGRGFSQASLFPELKKAEMGGFADMDGNGSAEIVFSPGPLGGPLQIYQQSAGSYVESTATFGKIAGSSDFAIADFNNDGLPDLYAGYQTAAVGIAKTGPGDIRYTTAEPASAPITEVRFKATGNVTFDFNCDDTLQPTQIYFNGSHPSLLSFSLSSPNTGPPDLESTIGRAVAIGYDMEAGEWVIKTRSAAMRSGVVHASEISSYSLNADQTYATSAPDRLYLNSGGTLKLSARFEGGTQSLGIGDFDNDMDLDIYLSRSGAATDLQDYILENQGNGVFVARSTADFGYAPTAGLSSAVAIADYNNDGFLDALTSDGDGNSVFNTQGRYRLLANGGNSNHWAELDFYGSESDRDGVGSKVLVRAGGITQMRTVGNVVHDRAQDMNRVHFGLAGNTRIDLIDVFWESGEHQVISALPADHLYRIVEIDSGSTRNVNRTGTQFDDVITGTAGRNYLKGGWGNDWIVGEGGGDHLFGGEGADTFVYGKLVDSFPSAYDRIMDLTDEDRIDLSQIDADATAPGDQAFHLTDRFRGKPGDLIVTYNPSSNETAIRGDVNGDWKVDLLIVALGNHLGFSNFAF